MSLTNEEAYRQYYLKNDICKEINGVPYYRLIHKEILELPERGKVIMILLPKEFKDCRLESLFVDENGTEIKLSPVHISFTGDIPEWYRNALHVGVFGFESIDDIGEYLAVKGNCL